MSLVVWQIDETFQAYGINYAEMVIQLIQINDNNEHIRIGYSSKLLGDKSGSK